MPKELIKQRIQYLIEEGVLDDPMVDLQRELRRIRWIAIAALALAGTEIILSLCCKS